MFIYLTIAWLCNLFDTIATLHLYLAYGGTELNPISALLLQSPYLFAFVKLVTMTIAVVFLWYKRDSLLAKFVGWFLCMEYTIVAIYYIAMYTTLA